MIMSCLVYKKPLPPHQIGKSLNEEMLPDARQLTDQNRIDEMFEMYDSEFVEADEGDNRDLSKTAAGIEESKDRLEAGDEIDEIEEEPGIVTIKTLTPSSEQLLSLNLQPGENIVTFSVKSRLQGE